MNIVEGNFFILLWTKENLGPYDIPVIGKRFLFSNISMLAVEKNYKQISLNQEKDFCSIFYWVEKTILIKRRVTYIANI